MIKKCTICGAEFRSSPSEKKSTCSPACRSERARRHAKKGRPWSAAARAKLAEKGRTANLHLGTPAASASPLSGPFATNQEAKIWSLITPEGERIVVRNLSLWLRENRDRIHPLRPRQLFRGLQQVAQCIEGKTKRGVSQSHGWRLERAPQSPEIG